MVSAIQNAISRGATATALSASASRSPSAKASLEAQLAQYQRQLSECVNCDSAKTLEGKNQIQAISSKIAAIRDSIAQVDKPVRSSSPTSAGTDATQGEITVDNNNLASDNGINAAQTTQATAGAGRVNEINGVDTLNATDANAARLDQTSPAKAANLTLGVHLDIYV